MSITITCPVCKEEAEVNYSPGTYGSYWEPPEPAEWDWVEDHPCEIGIEEDDIITEQIADIVNQQEPDFQDYDDLPF